MKFVIRNISVLDFLPSQNLYWCDDNKKKCYKKVMRSTVEFSCDLLADSCNIVLADILGNDNQNIIEEICQKD